MSASEPRRVVAVHGQPAGVVTRMAAGAIDYLLCGVLVLLGYLSASALIFVTNPVSFSCVLGDLGWPDQSIFDLGGIETALATEHVAPLFFAVVRAMQTPTFNLTLSR